MQFLRYNFDNIGFWFPLVMRLFWPQVYIYISAFGSWFLFCCVNLWLDAHGSFWWFFPDYPTRYTIVIQFYVSYAIESELLSVEICLWENKYGFAKSILYICRFHRVFICIWNACTSIKYECIPGCSQSQVCMAVCKMLMLYGISNTLFPS